MIIMQQIFQSFLLFHNENKYTNLIIEIELTLTQFWKVEYEAVYT